MTKLLDALFSAIIGWVVKLVGQFYEKKAQQDAEKRAEDAADAIEKGDTNAAEKAIGNPDAGKPSGRGRLRPRKTASGNDLGGGQ